MSDALLRFDGVTLGYGRKTVLENLTFDVRQGELLGIVGPNGSGKTTVLRAILGTLPPRRGHISFGSFPDRQGKGRLRYGYVPQRDSVNPLFPLSVLDIVMMGRYPLVGMLRLMRRADRDAALDCLRSVGLETLAPQQYRSLSGGQKQRVLIARALAGEPQLLVLDEPTNGMDLASEQAIMDLVRTLHGEGGRTILLVTHMLNLVANHVERIALIEGGQFVIGPTAEILSETNLQRLYGASVQVRQLEGRRVVLPGLPGASGARSGGEEAPAHA